MVPLPYSKEKIDELNKFYKWYAVVSVAILWIVFVVALAVTALNDYLRVINGIT